MSCPSAPVRPISATRPPPWDVDRELRVGRAGGILPGGAHQPVGTADPPCQPRGWPIGVAVGCTPHLLHVGRADVPGPHRKVGCGNAGVLPRSRAGCSDRPGGQPLRVPVRDPDWAFLTHPFRCRRRSARPGAALRPPTPGRSAPGRGPGSPSGRRAEGLSQGRRKLLRRGCLWYRDCRVEGAQPMSLTRSRRPPRGSDVP